MTHILIVTAHFYENISAEMMRGAEAAITEAGATFEHVRVPGALEIPSVIRYALESGKYDGYVALGCVIRGETYHFEIVCNDSARGLTSLAIEHQAAIGNGILTVETEEQAWRRAYMHEGNKGGDAAKAALALIDIKRKLGVTK